MWFMIVIILVAAPFTLWNIVTKPQPDMGQVGLSLLLIVCALAGAWKKITTMRAEDNQRRYWARRRIR